MDPHAPNIYDYFDYQRFLYDVYQHRHRNDFWFSYRYLQTKTGIDPAYLVRVLNGKKHLANKKIETMAAALGLSGREREYFRGMVYFAKAKSEEEKKVHFEKLLRYASLGSRIVDSRAYEYYTKWYHAVIRQILSYFKVKDDFKALARMTCPEISAREAKRSVALLESLGFIEPDEAGYYRPKERFVSTGEEWRSLAVRQFQRDCMHLAVRALDEISPQHRDISTVTVTVNADKLPRIAEIIKRTRREILEVAKVETGGNSVYHLNIQFFPVGRRSEEGVQ